MEYSSWPVVSLLRSNSWSASAAVESKVIAGRFLNLKSQRINVIHLKFVCLQSQFRWMCVRVFPDDDNSFQFHISDEGDVEEEFFISVRVYKLRETLIKGILWEITSLFQELIVPPTA